jgi:hypothetical protein
LQRLVESYIEKKVGKRWDDPVILDRLRAAIVSQKREYWREGERKEIRYRTGYSVMAYLAYQMPVFFIQFQHLLLSLAREGLFHEEMRILDLGSGPGVIPLAVTDFLRRLGGGSATIHALDAEEEHREAYQFLVPSFAEGVPGIRVESPLLADLATDPIEQLPHDIDLMVFSNVLNEMPSTTTEQKAAILHRYAPLLADDGTMVVVEPADRKNSTELRRISLAAAARGILSIYAPCTFLWGRQCTMDRCWSFVTYGEIHPPRLMEALAQGSEGYRFRNTDVKASFALLRKDGRTRCAHRMVRGAPYLRLSELSRHVGRVVNVIGAVISGDIGDREHHVTLICDGTSRKPVFVILPRYQVSPVTKGLPEAQYGDVLGFHEVLVRYNKSHDAFNLLLTARSRVHLPAPQATPHKNPPF